MKQFDQNCIKSSSINEMEGRQLGQSKVLPLWGGTKYPPLQQQLTVLLWSAVAPQQLMLPQALQLPWAQNSPATPRVKSFYQEKNLLDKHLWILRDSLSSLELIKSPERQKSRTVPANIAAPGPFPLSDHLTYYALHVEQFYSQLISSCLEKGIRGQLCMHGIPSLHQQSHHFLFDQIPSKYSLLPW